MRHLARPGIHTLEVVMDSGFASFTRAPE